MPQRKKMFEKGLTKGKGLKSNKRHYKRLMANKPCFVLIGVGKNQLFVVNRDRNINTYQPPTPKGTYAVKYQHYSGRFTGKSRVRYANPNKKSFLD